MNTTPHWTKAVKYITEAAVAIFFIYCVAKCHGVTLP